MTEEALHFSRRTWCGLLAGLALLAGCSSAPKRQAARAAKPAPPGALRLAVNLRESLLARAMLVVNTPYAGGGNTPETGFDCSGLVQWAVGGITSRQNLPRTTQQWAQASRGVQRRNLRRGDFVFFNTSGRPHSHMGIFVGNGQFVHAPSSGGVVRRARLDDTYFAPRFTEARSIFRA